ncbi:MAG TPA: DUF433 domain-containing protein [Chloroflexota bacterium]|nr:DUF433 domain-containing protein [Chloroflexota bacterium]
MATTRSGSGLIVRNPRIHGGEPIIRGTRVPVRSVVLSMEDDYPGDLQALAQAYGVSVEAVEAALAYYRAHKDEIDRFIEKRERAAYGR